ncbi:MAG: signal peptidase I [Crocinitomicaceae bacterium]|nr:signal peptidase I [Crocinitomicaceae bacterium]
MSILYFYIFLLVHPYLAMWWKSFPQAGRPSWEALIPVYNYYIAFKFGCKKPFWALLLVFPAVHLVMWSVCNVSYIRRFGYFTLVDTLQGVFFPYIIMAKIATSGDKALPETNWANTGEMGRREWGDHLALFLAVPVLGHAIAMGIGAVSRHKPGKKSKVKEWGDSLLFALIAASIIRTYVFEPFQIPTGSMEKTLLVGDFLFVNKLAYGPKVPQTPMSYPLVHNTVPWIDIKSYTQFEKLDYMRLPGFSEINRNDVVVFNYPSGDTAIYDPRMPNGLMGHDYHGYVLTEAQILYSQSQESSYWESEGFNVIKKNLLDANTTAAPEDVLSANQIDSIASIEAYDFKTRKLIENLEFWKQEARNFLASGQAHIQDQNGQWVVLEHYGTIYRPVDKRENYIKRCVGIAGDTMEIIASVLYVNGKPAYVAENQNLQYRVYGEISLPSDESMVNDYGLERHRGGLENGDYYRRNEYINGARTSVLIMNLTASQLVKLQDKYPEVDFELVVDPQYSDDPGRIPTYEEQWSNLRFFPKDISVNNTVSDFTKFVIPQKGATIKIDASNIAWYRRIITAYEGHTLEEKSDGIYIDGKKTTSYTFGMNYYWMMGDNRYNSADSRVWGFVPEDHIVGKASMVWFSKDPYQGIRTERIFNMIR